MTVLVKVGVPVLVKVGVDVTVTVDVTVIEYVGVGVTVLVKVFVMVTVAVGDEVLVTVGVVVNVEVGLRHGMAKLDVTVLETGAEVIELMPPAFPLKVTAGATATTLNTHVNTSPVPAASDAIDAGTGPET